VPSLSRVARIGYDSEAFKREYGRSPGDYRRRSAAQPIVVARTDRDAGSVVAEARAS
jgi:AraC-like DNA-binding protein